MMPIEMGEEPRNVHVIVSVDSDGVEAVLLQDGSGAFVRAGCPQAKLVAVAVVVVGEIIARL